MSKPGAPIASVIESRNFDTRWALTSSTLGSWISTTFCRVTFSIDVSR